MEVMSALSSMSQMSDGRGILSNALRAFPGIAYRIPPSWNFIRFCGNLL